MTLEITIEKMEPERLFSWRWHPVRVRSQAGLLEGTHDPGRLHPGGGGRGTLLTVVESGFDKVPSAYRATAFRSNDEGWAAQMKNIERHVTANPAT